jgi:hypothetical protein
MVMSAVKKAAERPVRWGRAVDLAAAGNICR